MGLPESPTRPHKNQATVRRKRRAPQPRLRRCLMKGCEQLFHPRQARQRYCTEDCRKAARRWSRWKAQQKYRASDGGKQKRNGQSRRYRDRAKRRRPPESQADSEAARVTTQEHFFRWDLRPARVLRAVRAPAAKSLAALLLCVVPACARAGVGTGEAMETSAHLIRIY